MVSRLGRPLLGAASLVLLTANTLLWCVPLYPAIVAKLLAPAAARAPLSRLLVRLAEGWIGGNNLALRLLYRITWDHRIEADLRPDASYLVLCNHRSWVDIVVLQHLSNRRIPFLRFFIKQELLWMPLLGIAWWALDYPFMRRRSRELRRREPGRADDDLARTRRACERLRGAPASLLNFLEGTRFTEEKRLRQGSPYRHLLSPKAGGLALALAGMGRELRSILDVTIAYPEGRCGLWDLLTGRLSRVVVWVRELPVPAELLSGDYQGDPAFRDRVQAWVRTLWREKDALLSSCLDSGRH